MSELWRQMEVHGWKPFEGALVGGDSAYDAHKDWLVTPFPTAMCRARNVSDIFTSHKRHVLHLILCQSGAWLQLPATTLEK